MGFKIGLAEKRKKKLEEELKLLIPKIIKAEVEKIILFGSLSHGNLHKTSDIDLIIVQKTEKRFLERLDEFYKYLNPSVAVDIFVYTPQEFEEMKRSSFMKSALRRGKVLYER